MSPDEARRSAWRKFGNVTRVKEETWEVWSSPGSSSSSETCASAPARCGRIGILHCRCIDPGSRHRRQQRHLQRGGRCCSCRAALPQPDRLVMVLQNRPNLKQLGISYPDFQEWQHGARPFEQIAAGGRCSRGNRAAVDNGRPGHAGPVHRRPMPADDGGSYKKRVVEAADGVPDIRCGGGGWSCGLCTRHGCVVKLLHDYQAREKVSNTAGTHEVATRI
jgi:hypothetical protein